MHTIAPTAPVADNTELALLRRRLSNAERATTLTLQHQLVAAYNGTRSVNELLGSINSHLDLFPADERAILHSTYQLVHRALHNFNQIVEDYGNQLETTSAQRPDQLLGQEPPQPGAESEASAGRRSEQRRRS